MQIDININVFVVGVVEIVVIFVVDLVVVVAVDVVAVVIFVLLYLFWPHCHNLRF